jgi:gluconate kinase
MLASLEKNIVISEPPPIDSVLRANDGRPVSKEERALWLKWMINAYGQKRHQAEENLFIKFDSWSVTDLDLIRAAFPHVPWVFLYRNPVEVIVSQMNQRGVHMIPGVIRGILPDASDEEILAMKHEEYCSRVLERICRSALEFAGEEKGLFVNYSELPHAVTAEIVRHFGVNFTTEETERMRSAARFNAKTPQLDFEPDTEAKKRSASDEARSAARRVEPLFAQFEAARIEEAV